MTCLIPNRAAATDIASSKKNLLVSGSQFIKQLTRLCNDNRPAPLEFPDGFSVSNISVACETAFHFNQEENIKPAIEFAFGRQFAGVSTVSYREHSLFASSPPSLDGTLNFVVPEKNSSDLWKIAHQTGTASGLFAFLISEERHASLNAASLRNKHISFLKQYYSEKFIDFLINPQTVAEKNKNWDAFVEYLELYFENLQGMSKFYSNRIALNLIDHAVAISGTDSPAEFALIIPDEIASNVLALFTFSADLNEFYPEVKWILRARVFSAREQREIHGLGEYEQFYNGHLNVADNAYIYQLLSLRDRLNLNAHHEPRLVFETLAYVSQLEQSFPYLKKTYEQFFRDLENSGVWQLKPNDLRKHYRDILTGSKKPESHNLKDRFLFSDILSVSRAPWNVEDSELENLFSPKNRNLFEVTKLFFNELRVLSFKTHGTGPFKSELKTQRAAFKQYGESETNCGDLGQLQCRKMIVDPDLLDVGDHEFDVGVEENINLNPALGIAQPQFCELTKPMEKWLSEAGVRGAVHFNAWYLCRLEQIATYLGFDEDNFFANAAKLMISSGPTGYNNVSANRGFLLKGGGMIANNAMAALKIPHVMSVPSDDTVFHLAADRKAKAFFKSVSDLSTKPAIKTNFQINRNERAIATIYAQNGQFERALITRLGTLSTTIKDANETHRWTSIARTIVGVDLARIKSLMRQIGFPESQISAFISQTVKQLNWDILDPRNYESGFLSQQITSASHEIFLGYLQSNFDIAAELAQPLPRSESRVIKYGPFKYILDEAIALTHAIGLSSTDKTRLCSDVNVRNRILSVNNQTEALFGLSPRKNLPKFQSAVEFVIFTDQSFFYGFLELYHICQKSFLSDGIANIRSDENYEPLVNREHLKTHLKTYANHYLASLVYNWIKKGMDVSDVRFLPALAGLSRVGRIGAIKNNQTVPNSLALVAAKHAFFNLGNSFVTRNSATMRNYQPDLEAVISNTSDIITRVRDRDKYAFKALVQTFHDMEDSARIIITSDATRKRLIGFIGFENIKPANDGWLGVRYTPVPEVTKSKLGEEIKDGALVESVLPHSPAEKSDIKIGDIIYEMDQINIGDLAADGLLIPSMNAGEIINFGIYRNGEYLVKTIEIEKNKDLKFIQTDNAVHFYNLTSEYFQKNNEKLSHSKDLSDFIKTKASFGEHNNNIVLTAMAGGNTSADYFRREYNFLRHMTVNYDLGFVTASTFNSSGKKHTFSRYVSPKAIEKHIALIGAESSISDEQIISICETFEPFWSELNVPEANVLTVIPSLNLMPIPIELVIGTGCQKSEQKVVIASSFLAGVEFHLSTIQRKKPNTFVGHANPMKRDNTFKISLGDIKRSLNSIEAGTAQNLNLPPLPDASVEVTDIAQLFDTSHTYIDQNASIKNVGKKLEELASQGSDAVVLFATHGLAGSNEQQTALPALLSIEDNEFEAINSAELNNLKLTNSTVLLSACDTASGIIDKPDKMFTGLVESFANAGARLILASLWPVGSVEAKRVTTSFVREWKQSNLSKAIEISKTPSFSPGATLPFVYIAP